jgi:alpha-beta hydrolase superfamily lysophospholipase
MVHSEYYLSFATRLASEGITVWLPDLRGHGRSEGSRGHVQHWHDHVRDIASVWDAMQRVPVTGTAIQLVGGESYGALMAYWAVKLQAVAPDAILLLSPAMELQFQFSPPVWWFLNHVVKPVFPTMRPLAPLGYQGVSSDPAIGRLIERDPMTTRHYTLSFFLNLIAAQKLLRQPEPPLPYRLLAVLSAGDRICNNRAPRAMFTSDPKAQITVLSGQEHSLIADRPDELADTVTTWMGTLNREDRSRSS